MSGFFWIFLLFIEIIFERPFLEFIKAGSENETPWTLLTKRTKFSQVHIIQMFLKSTKILVKLNGWNWTLQKDTMVPKTMKITYLELIR